MYDESGLDKQATLRTVKKLTGKIVFVVSYSTVVGIMKT